MKFFLRTALLLLLPCLVYAQANYQPGFIVKTNGDTLRGVINYRENDNTPRIIEFKNSTSDRSVTQFGANDLKAFTINNTEVFISYRGKLSLNKNILTSLPSYVDTTNIQDTVFLKTLVKGVNVSLYSQSDAIKTRYFVAEKDNLPVELGYYPRMRETTVLPGALYKGQLMDLLKKYTSVTNTDDLLKDVTYDDQKLIGVVNIINHQQSQTLQKGKVYWRLFAGAAVSRVSTTVDGENFPFTGAPADVEYRPVLSVGFDLLKNPLIQHVFFRTELSFYTIKPSYSVPVVISGPDQMKVYTFRQTNISITPQLIYNVYDKPGLKFFIGAGARLNYSVYTDNKVTYTNVDPQLAVSYNKEKPYDLESFWFSFPVSAGVNIARRVEASFSYMQNTAFTTYTGFSIGSQMMNVGVKYFIKSR
ncbi:PorT family protein [Mucilaginibacter sp. RS28]|uniref:PorT family protein n=1 Tax=Mucilaginibacter straminoryzae TaxID=2932774 RepID=A0A9X1X6T1_9SPHI|nr:outer membrane beta-barrel protein [Mucilaginibacter straminoryzae]MCJ8211943.1 PorT family protein [Mucilaginibacter straminoryzae]